VTQTTPHPQLRGIMPPPRVDDDATHRHDGTGHPAKSKSETGWNKIGGGGLVKEYRRENTREYSRLRESTKGCDQNNQIQLHPCGAVHLPPVQPNELRSHPEGQMQVDSGLSHLDSQVQDDSRSHPDCHVQVNSGVSQIARDSYDQLLVRSHLDSQVDSRSHPDCQVNSGVSQLAMDSYDQLLATELEIQRLRRSLLQELKSTKHVLLSSLRSVEALGEDAKGIPLPSDSNGVSTNSASLNTTSASSAGDRRSMHTEMLEQLLLAPVQERDGRELEGRLARPPTSPPLPYQRAPTSPLSVAASSGHFSATPSPGSELLARLRSEVDLLREERQAASERWARERRALERQLLEARDGGREAERRRSVEEQLRDILTVVRSLNTMDISEEVLGRMVVEAVEEAYDPVADEVAVFHFLVLLYNSTREYEKLAADLMLEKALKASEEGHYSVSVS